MTLLDAATVLSNYQIFLKHNPHFNLNNAQIFQQNTLSALNWRGVDQKSFIPQLQGLQRLFRVTGDLQMSTRLLAEGVHSAKQIAEMSKKQFATNYSHIFNGNTTQAEATFNKALAKKTQIVMNYMSIMHHTSAYYQSTRFNNLSAITDAIFNGLPNYEQLFGGLDYCSCDDCRTIYSPAAYLVELIRLKNAHLNVTADAQKFEDRRPDIENLVLSSANTTNMVPYLDISNSIMETYITSHPISNGNDIYEKLFPNSVYPFNQPFNLALTQLRTYLRQQQQSLLNVYRTLGVTLAPTLAINSGDSGTISNCDNLNFDTKAEFTIEFWIQTNLTDLNDHLIIAKEGNNIYPYKIFLHTSATNDDTNNYLRIIAAKYDNTNNPAIHGTIKINDGQYHHVAFIRSKDGNLYLYVDGKLDDHVQDSTQTTTENNADVSLFSYSGATNPFEGNFFELRIWNTDRSQQNIQQYMYSRLTGYEDNLVGYWPLINNSKDFSQYKQDITLSHISFLLSDICASSYFLPYAFEILRLSPEIYNYISVPQTNLCQAYGLASTDVPVTTLSPVNTFIQQTNLTVDQLTDLLIEDLADTEIGNYAKDFFINNSGESLQFITVEGGNLQNLSIARLDRINRFIRLANQLNYSFTDLDWLLQTVARSDIDELTLQNLAPLVQWQVQYNLPVNVIAGLWGYLKMTGAKSGSTYFDNIFNNTNINNASQLPNDSLQLTINPDSQPDDTLSGLISQLMVALQITENELTLLVIYLLQPSNPSAKLQLNMTKSNLTLLYRLSMLAKVLNISIKDEVNLLSNFTNFSNSMALADFTTQNQALADIVTLLKTNDIKTDEICYLLASNNGAININNAIQNPVTQVQAANFLNNLYSSFKQLLLPNNLIQKKSIDDIYNESICYLHLSADTQDSSQNKNNATPVPSTTSLIYSGSIGNYSTPVLDLTSSTSSSPIYLTINNLTSVDKSFTLAAWVYFSNAQDENDKIIISKHTKDGSPDNCAEFLLKVDGTSGSVCFVIGATKPDSNTDIIGINLTAPSSLNNNQWYFITATFDFEKNQGSLYIDGIQVASAAFSDTRQIGSEPVNIGYLKNDKGTNVYNGYIAEVSIYENVLSLDDINNIINALSNLVSYLDKNGIVQAMPIMPTTNIGLLINQRITQQLLNLYQQQQTTINAHLASFCAIDVKTLPAVKILVSLLTKAYTTNTQGPYNVINNGCEDPSIASVLLQKLLSPFFSSDTLILSANTITQDLMTCLDYFLLFAYFIQKTQLTGDEINFVLQHPACFAISDYTALSLDNFKNILNFKVLLKSFNDKSNGLLTYLSTPISGPVDGSKICTLSQWDIMQYNNLVNQFWPNNINYAQTIPGLMVIKAFFDMANLLSVKTDTLVTLQKTATLLASYDDYQKLSQAIYAGLKSKYSSADWIDIDGSIQKSLRENKRDQLVPYIIYLLNPNGDNKINTARDVYEYFLNDVETAGNITISIVFEAISALQLYLYRCQMGLEQGASFSEELTQWWPWIENYRVWEANRQIFLYPENYIQPELRRNKTMFFDKFEDDLRKAEINTDSAETAFNDYLDSFGQVANLIIAGSCSYQDLDNQQQILCLFGRTQTQSFQYYYRTAQYLIMPVTDGSGDIYGSLTAPSWTPWEKIELSINSPYVNPVYAFGKLYIFWVEIHQSSQQTSSTFNIKNNVATADDPAPTFYTDLCYSFYNFNKNWITPQKILGSDGNSIIPPNPNIDLTNSYWQKIYALFDENYHLCPPALLTSDIINDVTVCPWSKILAGDVNGDNIIEIVFAYYKNDKENGISIYQFQNGTWVRLNHTEWSDFPNKPKDWNDPKYYSTLQLAVVEKGNPPSLIIRLTDGLHFYGLNPSKDQWTWNEQQYSNELFSDAVGFNSQCYYSTIHIIDMDNDGYAEIVARGIGGLSCYKYSKSNSWQQITNSKIWPDPDVPKKPGQTDWTQSQYYSTIQLADIDADGKIEIIGRCKNGLSIYKLNLDGNDWEEVISEANATLFSDTEGWGGNGYYPTIHTADVNGDGKIEVFALGISTLSAHCLNDSYNWVELSYFCAWTDNNGWGNDKTHYYSSIIAADIDGDGTAELCGIGPYGFEVYKFYPKLNTWLPYCRDSQLSYDNTFFIAADINNDGKDELIIFNNNGLQSYQLNNSYHDNNIYLFYGPDYTSSQYTLISLDNFLQAKILPNPSQQTNLSPITPFRTNDSQLQITSSNFLLWDTSDEIPSACLWLPFDNSIADESNSKHTVTQVGSGLAYTNDNYNNPNGALCFGGTGNIETLQIQNINLTNNLTINSSIAFWFNCISFGTDKYEFIVDIFNTNDKEAVIYCYLEQDTNTLYVACGNISGLCLKVNNINLNQWYHVVIVAQWLVNDMKKVTASLYLNGKYSDSLSDYTNLLPNPNNLNIGGDADSTTSYFTGYLSQFIVYPETLTESQISQLYYYNPQNALLLANIPSSSTINSIHNQASWFIFNGGNATYLANTNQMTETLSRQIQVVVGKDEQGNDQTSVQFFGSDYPTTTQYNFSRLNSTAVSTLSQRLLLEGVDGLLDLDTQTTAEISFLNMQPNMNIINKDFIPSDTIDINGANGLYYWEIFFHAPYYIANCLSNAQNYEDAKKWYQYIFNPTILDDADATNDRYWRFLALRAAYNPILSEELTNSPVQEYEEELNVASPRGKYDTGPVQVYNYFNDPFDPHAIASLRPIAYQKSIVMNYIDNLLNWGDQLFRTYTLESIVEARAIYTLAYDMLGRRPLNTGPCNLPAEVSVSTLLTNINKATDLANIDEFVLIENQTLSTFNDVATDTPNNYIPNAYFGIPENDQFIQYWDLVENRLYKIRNGLNIDGVPQSLPMMQPPINPLLLIQATATGASVSQAIADIKVNIPYYRFSYMVEKAKSATAFVTELGNSLLSALEKNDAEQLALLANTQEQNILNLTRDSKVNQLQVTNETVQGLQASLQNAQARLTYYTTLIQQGLSAQETSQVLAMNMAHMYSTIGQLLQMSGGISHLIPQVGSPFAMTFGGVQLGPALEGAATVCQFLSGQFDFVANLNAMLGGWERRAEDWQLQQTLAQNDLNDIQHQLNSAQLQQQIAQNDLQILDQSTANSKATESFLLTKFTNQELYQWIIGKLSTLYFQAYQQAYAYAISAQASWQYEIGQINQNFISPIYWDSLRQGLLSGEALNLDLLRMEKAYIDNNSRRLEIMKTFSLLQLDPNALSSLQSIAKTCTFQFTEDQFKDYGAYYCQIKTLTISIPAVLGPYQNLCATLTQLSNQTRIQPDTTTPLVSDNRPSQQIAISQGINDSGMFELNFQDERYLPFEGTGVISSWKLDISGDVDSKTITDVIIRVNFTGLPGGASYKSQLAQQLNAIKRSPYRMLSLATEFAPAWTRFINSTQNNSQRAITFKITPKMFPVGVKQAAYHFAKVYLQLNLTEKGIAKLNEITLPVLHLSINQQSIIMINLRNNEGIISANVPLSGAIPLQESDWLLSINASNDLQGLFVPDYVKDIGLIITCHPTENKPMSHASHIASITAV